MGDEGESMALLDNGIQYYTNPKGSQGISLFTAVCYIFGLFSVIPIIVLPGAIVNTGWVGFILAGILLLTEAYTAVLLSRTWLLIEVFWPELAQSYRRNPYPGLAEKVGGPRLRRCVTVMLNIAVFGQVIPFLLLASRTLQELIETMSQMKINVSFCYWLIVITFLLIPFVNLGTPKDFGLITIVGAAIVILVGILVHIKIFINAPIVDPKPAPAPTWSAVAYLFGSLAFQFDIHPMILTVQMDMKEKHRLPIALVIAFGAGMMLFLSISCASYFIYGGLLKPNLLNNFTRGPFLYFIMFIVALQSLICIVLGINTLFQDMEDTLGIPDQFCFRRFILRTTVMLLVLFVSESLPHMSVVIELVGGLCVTPFIFIFPPIFYMILKYKASGRLDVKELVISTEIILVGIIGMVSATVESIIEIAALSEFAPPCYIDVKAASTNPGQDVILFAMNKTGVNLDFYLD